MSDDGRGAIGCLMLIAFMIGGTIATVEVLFFPKPSPIIYPKKQYLVTTKSPIGLTSSKETMELSEPEVVYRWGRYVIFEHIDSKNVKIVKQVPVGWNITLEEAKNDKQ